MIQLLLFTSQQLMAGLRSNHRLSSGLLAGWLGLSLMTPVHASERIRWTPNTERGSIGSTLSGGRRGQAAVSCHVADDATQLALVVPEEQSSLLTTTTTPTLAWNITTATPVSMTFHFSDPDLATPIYTQTLELEKTSTVSITLPNEHSLVANKKYRWTVFVSCPGEYQTEIFARSFVEHVDREFLDITHLSSLEQASIYAEQGIWYDAIAVLLATENPGQQMRKPWCKVFWSKGKVQQM